MLLIFFFGFWAYPYETGQPRPWRNWGGHILIWILLAMLGWKVFGAGIKP
jgi:hypothetical protein